MPINRPYGAITDLPAVVPVFPLTAALLLPRAHLPLNIFEPRYLAMVDAVLASHRLIGMIQPAPDQGDDDAKPALCGVGCLGRVTAFQETGDGRVLVTLTGVARFRVEHELTALTPYRQCRVSYAQFADDLMATAAGEEAVDRKKLLTTFHAYLDANNLEADWSSINQAPNEMLVNALSMMAPYGPREKQALLEAGSLKDRADILVAMTEMVLAKSGAATDTRLN
jgi:Lon protease-like protein